MGNKNRARVLQEVVSVFVIGGALCLLHVMGVVVCPLNRFFGIPCPTCGTMRGIFALMQGHIQEALQCQPILIPALILGGILWGVSIIRRWRGLSGWWGKIPPVVMRFAVILFILALILNWGRRIWEIFD